MRIELIVLDPGMDGAFRHVDRSIATLLEDFDGVVCFFLNQLDLGRITAGTDNADSIATIGLQVIFQSDFKEIVERSESLSGRLSRSHFHRDIHIFIVFGNRGVVDLTEGWCRRFISIEEETFVA